MKKTLAVGLVIFAFAFSSVPLASAQTMSTADEQALIQTLQAQILVLIQQINTILAQRGATTGNTVVGRPVKVVPVDSSAKSITVISPNGGESYVSGSGSIKITYRSTGIAGQALTAYLYSPVYNNVRSISNNYAADSGTIVMDLEKAGADPVGQYKITLCANNVDTGSGKSLCDSSDNYFTLTADGTTTGVGVAPTISYVSPNPVMPGSQLTVYGSGIDAITYVLFDGRSGIPATSYTSSSLTFTVPSNTTAGAKSVELLETSSSPRSNLVYVTVGGTSALNIPTISYLSPSTVVPGGRMIVYGSNFDSNTYIAIDQSNSSLAQTIIPDSQGPTALTFSMPGSILIGGHALQVGEKGGPLPSGYALFTVTQGQSAAPTASLSASASNVTVGQPFTLTWSSTGATDCYANFTGPNGSTHLATGGSVQATLNQTFNYYISCNNNSGQYATSNATVNVTQSAPVGTVQTGFILVNGSHTNNQTLAYNSTPTISWNVSGASSCSLKDANGTYSYLQPGNASVTISNPPMTKSTTFTVSCDNGAYDALWVIVSPNTATGGTTTGGTVTNSVSLKLNGSHTMQTLAANTTPILSWSSTDTSASCSITSSDGRYSYLQGANGQVTLNNPALTQSTTFSISCSNGTSDSVSVVVASSGSSTTGTVTNTGSTDPYTGASYSQTSSTPLASSERTVTYTYPSSPCGSLMNSYTTPGSVSVGNGPVYTAASQICSPDTSTFRTYSCYNSSVNGSILGTATFAFQCNSTTNSANALDAISQLIQRIREQLSSGGVQS